MSKKSPVVIVKGLSSLALVKGKFQPTTPSHEQPIMNEQKNGDLNNIHAAGRINGEGNKSASLQNIHQNHHQVRLHEQQQEGNEKGISNYDSWADETVLGRGEEKVQLDNGEEVIEVPVGYTKPTNDFEYDKNSNMDNNNNDFSRDEGEFIDDVYGSIPTHLNILHQEQAEESKDDPGISLPENENHNSKMTFISAPPEQIHTLQPQGSESIVSNNPAFSWSSTFHSQIDEVRRVRRDRESNTSKSLEAHQSLKNIAHDFSNAAAIYGRIIIEEVHLDDEEKTIKPADLGGFAGGRKYIVHGILFKFAHNMDLYGADDNANKVASHELRSCAAIAGLALGEDDIEIYPPLMAIIDFRGFRLLAVSALPITKETIVYGSCDGAKSVHNDDQEVDKMISKISSKLNLKRHKALYNVDIDLGTDCEVHVADCNDNRYISTIFPGTKKRIYIVDLARLYPPECPFRTLPSSLFAPKDSSSLNPTDISSELGPYAAKMFKIGNSETVDEQDNRHLFRQLRPSFVHNYERPLSSDAFSRFGIVDKEIHNLEVAQATIKLKTTVIERACAYLRDSPAIASQYPSQFSLTEFLHSRGINMRHLYLVYRKLPIESPWRNIVRIEMVARSFKTFLRRKWREKAESQRGRPSDGVYHIEAITQINNLLLELPDVGNSWQKNVRYKKLMEDTEKWWESLANILEQKFGLDANGIYSTQAPAYSEGLISSSQDSKRSRKPTKTEKLSRASHDHNVPNPSSIVMGAKISGVAQLLRDDMQSSSFRQVKAKNFKIPGKRRFSGVNKSLDESQRTPAKLNQLSTRSSPAEFATSAPVINNTVSDSAEAHVLSPIYLYETADRRLLLQRICQMLGFEFDASFKMDEINVTPDFILSSEHLKNIVPTVKHLEIVRYAEAKVLELKALKNDGCFDMGVSFLKSALEKIDGYRMKQPVSEWIIRDLGEVSFELGARLPPDRSEDSLKLIMRSDTAYRESVGRDFDREATKEKGERTLRSNQFEISSSKKADTNLDEIFLRDATIRCIMMAKQFATVYNKIVANGFERAYALALSPSQRYILIGGSNEGNTGPVGLYDTRSRRRRWLESNESWIRTAMISEQYKSVFIGENGSPQIVARSLNNGRIRTVYSIKEKDRVYTSFDKPFYSMMEKDTYFRPGLPRKILGICSLRVAKGQDILFGASFEGAIYMWDMKTGAYIDAFIGHEGTVTSLDVDTKRKIIASSSSDRTAIIWNIETRKPIRVFGVVGNTNKEIGHTGQVTSVALSRRNLGETEELIVCTTSFDTTCRIWNGETGICERVLIGHLSGVWHACFIGPSIVVTASGDGTIRIWSVDYGRCIRMLLGHSDDVYKLAYSRISSTLYSASADGTLREWSLPGLSLTGGVPNTDFEKGVVQRNIPNIFSSAKPSSNNPSETLGASAEGVLLPTELPSSQRDKNKNQKRGSIPFQFPTFSNRGESSDRSAAPPAQQEVIDPLASAGASLSTNATTQPLIENPSAPAIRRKESVTSLESKVSQVGGVRIKSRGSIAESENAELYDQDANQSTKNRRRTSLLDQVKGCYRPMVNEAENQDDYLQTEGVRPLSEMPARQVRFQHGDFASENVELNTSSNSGNSRKRLNDSKCSIM